jgi:hypothetical protein
MQHIRVFTWLRPCSWLAAPINTLMRKFVIDLRVHPKFQIRVKIARQTPILTLLAPEKELQVLKSGFCRTPDFH